MSESSADISAKPAASFYDKAAWYSLVTPFATIAFFYAVGHVMDHLSIPPYTQNNVSKSIIASAFLLQFANVMFGFLICVNFARHKRRLTIWASLLAILASCGVGFMTFIGLALSNMGHGC